jgi:hypothetical protein
MMMNKIRTWLKQWWKRNIADDVPENLNDIF